VNVKTKKQVILSRVCWLHLFFKPNNLCPVVSCITTFYFFVCYNQKWLVCIFNTRWDISGFL